MQRYKYYFKLASVLMFFFLIFCFINLSLITQHAFTYLILQKQIPLILASKSFMHKDCLAHDPIVGIGAHRTCSLLSRNWSKIIRHLILAYKNRILPCPAPFIESFMVKRPLAVLIPMRTFIRTIGIYNRIRQYLHFLVIQLC